MINTRYKQASYYKVCLVVNLQTLMSCSYSHGFWLLDEGSSKPGSLLCIIDRSQLSWTALFLLQGKDVLKLVFACVLTSLLKYSAYRTEFKNTVE